MFQKIVLIFLLIFSLHSCSKKNEVRYNPGAKTNPYALYQEGVEAFLQKRSPIWKD